MNRLQRSHCNEVGWGCKYPIEGKNRSLMPGVTGLVFYQTDMMRSYPQEAREEKNGKNVKKIKKH
ncbi:MAG: hypothetical protein ABIK68_10360, partial [bacterium]